MAGARTPDDTETILDAAAQALAAGDAARSVELATSILARAPHEARARALRVNAWLTLERWADAIPDLEDLTVRQPASDQLHRLLALCWLRIGNTHRTDADRGAAIDAYRRAIAAAPQLQDARHNLATLFLALDRPRDALPLLQIVTAAEPGNELAALDLARAHAATGAHAAAILRARALASRSADPAVRKAAADLLLAAGDVDAAARAISQVAADPLQWPWILAQTRRLRDNADLAASDEVLAALSARPLPEPARLGVALHRALGLPSVYASADELARVRQRYAQGLEQLIAEYPPQRIAAIAPDAEVLRWDNFLLAYQGCDDRALQQRFGAWYADALQRLVPIERVRTPRARARPRVALPSGRWHHCTAGMYFGAWVEHLAACGWDVVLVHAGAYRDAWTERLARAASAELTLTGSLADSAARIRALDADLVLYPELGMDSTVLALAALRLAPVQACGWGHPSTTGLPTIDAFISCADMEPAGGSAHYSERLLTLPGLGTRYPAPEVPDAAARAELGLPKSGPLYFVPQSAFKLHPDNDDVLCRIVEKDTDAVFVLFADRAPGAAQRLQRRLVARLGALGVAPERHLRILEQRSRSDYLRINRACSVMVDSLHWSGGNTTLDALHCGVPVVTCPGALMRGRQSMAMLQALGHPELIAATPQELADTACRVAHDDLQRRQTGANLRSALPRLTQSDAPLAALDALLRGLLAADAPAGP